MMMNRNWIATQLSCFALLATIAAGCNDEDCCSGRAGSATSLVGPVDCGSEACGSGELCVTFYAGIDSGTDEGQSHGVCTPAPALCVVKDCGTNGMDCPSCLDNLCPELTWVSVMGRDVACGGA